MIEAATEKTLELAEKLGIPPYRPSPEPPDYETHAAALATGVRLLLSDRATNPQWRRLCEVHLADYDQAVAAHEEARDA